MRIGKKISQLRKQKGISQYQLAERINISTTYLSLIENDKRFPNIETLEKLCAEINLPLPVLFFQAIEEKDIPENKRKLFAEFSPLVNSFIDNIFIK